MTVNGKTYQEGDYLSINGTAGEVYPGEIKTAASEIVQVLVEKSLDAEGKQDLRIVQTADGLVLQSDAPAGAHQRRHARANRECHCVRRDGHRLCRTEHMFFEGERIDAMREMILAENVEDRKKALAQAAAVSKGRFRRHLQSAERTIRRRFVSWIRRCMNSCRTKPAAQQDLARKMGVPVERIKQRVNELHEFNPMLGFRGCRLGIVHSEISEMQARAVFEAAAEVQAAGIKAKPEIMIPLVGFKKELDLQVEVVHRVAKEVMAEKKVKLNYLVGTMIEVPRGALTADEIARDCRVLQLRHERPDSDVPRHEPRRFGFVPAGLCRTGDREEESVRDDRSDRRRPADEDRRRERAGKPARTSSSASAASTAAIRIR